jgi:hypothetical protein
MWRSGKMSGRHGKPIRTAIEVDQQLQLGTFIGRESILATFEAEACWLLLLAS